VKRRVVLVLAAVLFASAVARADQIPIGLVSFDVFIPASATGPGTNAFDIFNFTGPTFGPTVGPPYAADSLTFDNATLTVNFQGGSSQVINLGNIGPGELLDSMGNPVVQFPSTDSFTSAMFAATLSPASFMLSDGTTFRARASVSADVVPSSGSSLQAGVDLAVINAVVVPEPNTFVLVGPATIWAFVILRRKQSRL
jgi:hypothetical protein